MASTWASVIFSDLFTKSVDRRRPEVLDHWRDAQSWIVPPVMVRGNVLGSSMGFDLLVGFTRLGNLLGLLDRQQVPEDRRHLVWVGS